jgi:hypothetical protein
MLLHYVVVIEIAEELNDYLIKSDPQIILATLENCRKLGGTEYCDYCYTVNRKTYKHKILNETTNYKNGNTIRVLYYKTNPALSKPE